MHIHFHRNRYIWITISVWVLWNAACSPNPPVTTKQDLNTMEATMPLSQLKTTPEQMIPPLDRAIPETIDTATFGLG